MWQLQKLHEVNVKKISDINQHLWTLHTLASECKHITEFWVRTWVSSISILAWAPKWAKVISFDICKTPEVDQIWQMVKADKKDWTFIKYSTKDITIDATDMLFIDTLHDYAQLKHELRNNHSLVRKYIVMHDTETFGTHGETPGKAWLRYAITEFLENHKERDIDDIYYNNNWLTVLKRFWDVDLHEKDFKPIVCVYTAIYGDQDILKLQPNQTIDVDYVCYTDNPDLECEPGARKQRKIIVEAPFKHLHPRMQAKYYRTHPSLLWDYEYRMRVDWTTKFKRMDTVEYLLSQFLPKSDILCYKHDNRDCIYDEATYSQQFEKYKWQPMQSQVAYYKSQWHPEHYGLSATWLLITRKSDYYIQRMLNSRWQECLIRTYQDQLSFDVMVREYWLKRQWIKESQFQNNPYVLFTWKHKHEK